MHLKCAKKDPKIFFVKNNNLYIKKRDIYTDFKFVDADLDKCL
jgi:hypothetical protein